MALVFVSLCYHRVADAVGHTIWRAIINFSICLSFVTLNRLTESDVPSKQFEQQKQQRQKLRIGAMLYGHAILVASTVLHGQQ